uniref:Uncharacterized protein n=1 Tax=viral metagenome TaxID=1070528 RepID=A0A6C0F609_9ZZZZ|tara:strand:+ start:17344 stop:17571 length:228 start_codon:yes stop_codon:yes gene_type:complete
MIEIIDLTNEKNPKIIINITNNNNTNEVQKILGKINPCSLKKEKEKKMYRLANNKRTPIKERLQAAKKLKRYISK